MSEAPSVPNPVTTPGDGSAPSGHQRPSGAWLAGLRRITRQPRFVIAAAVLLVSAIGFNAAATALQLHFQKESVPLRVRALDDKVEGVPDVLGGRWFSVSDDQPLTEAFEHALGTRQYVFRDYLDMKSRNLTEGELRKKSHDQLKQLADEARSNDPASLVRIAVTYYTGLVDTVPHVADRCMVADGFQVVDYQEIDGPATYVDHVARPLKFRHLTFQDVTNRGRVERNVGYFFFVNGERVDDPLEVRARLQNLFERYGYFAKVELMTESTKSTGGQKSIDAMRDLLQSLVPQVERCLPDWDMVKQKSQR